MPQWKSSKWVSESVMKKLVFKKLFLVCFGRLKCQFCKIQSFVWVGSSLPKPYRKCAYAELCHERAAWAPELRSGAVPRAARLELRSCAPELCQKLRALSSGLALRSCATSCEPWAPELRSGAVPRAARPELRSCAPELCHELRTLSFGTALFWEARGIHF